MTFSPQRSCFRFPSSGLCITFVFVAGGKTKVVARSGEDIRALLLFHFGVAVESAIVIKENFYTLTFVLALAFLRLLIGETGVGCHTGWLSHCQYLIRWMAEPCGDLHVTCA